MEFKDLLRWVGAAAFVLIFLVFAIIWVAFYRGEQADWQQGNVGLCGNVPEPYKTIFTKAGDKWKVQPAFIAAIFLAGEHHRTHNQDGSWVTTFDPNTPWPDANQDWGKENPSSAGAKGPFQFMPATWEQYKEDGNNDGSMDIYNLWDAAFGAAHKLAMGGAAGNTTDLDKLRDAAASYNDTNWGKGQGIPETAAYVPRVIDAFKYFYCQAVAGKWIWPVEGIITSEFGEIGPSHPQPHTGIDIAAVKGTSIKAADAGTVTVINSDPNNACGVYVKIKHSEGLEAVYCHMVENSPTVSLGESVSQGQTIGQVDNTASAGHSTGNHLHFGVKFNNEWVNPRNYLPSK